MKMNKMGLLSVSMLLLTAAGLPHTAGAAEDHTTVTITGMVNDNTCTLTGAQNGLSFTLSPVSVRDFGAGAGNPVGEIDIPVEFTDCGSGTKGVTVKVTGASAGSTAAFKNTLDANGSGGATGVGVNFYDTDGTQIEAGTDVAAAEQTFGSEGTTLHYKASYTKVADEVKAGSLSTVITLSFTYS